MKYLKVEVLVLNSTFQPSSTSMTYFEIILLSGNPLAVKISILNPEIIEFDRCGNYLTGHALTIIIYYTQAKMGTNIEKFRYSSRLCTHPHLDSITPAFEK